MNQEITIVGSGALATLFAFRLSKVGVRVTILGTWQEGLKALRERGACLEGGESSPVNVTDDPADCQGSKYALVLVKSWQTPRAALQLKECLSDDGLAVTLQNGLGNDAILSNILGSARVSRGVTTLGATLLAPGIVRQAGEGRVVLEEHSHLSGLWEMMRIANVELLLVKDASPDVWRKLIVNAAINPLTALLRIRNGNLLVNPPARAIMEELALEAASVAKAYGIEFSTSTPKEIVENVVFSTADNASSMLQDVLRGTSTEVDAINGAIVRMGEERGIPTPVNRIVCSLVKAIPVHDRIMPVS